MLLFRTKIKILGSKMNLEEKVIPKSNMLDEIKSNIRDKNFLKAEELCILLLNAEPKNAEALYHLGRIKGQLKQPQDSINCLAAAIKQMEQKTANWCVDLGNTYCEDSKYDEALEQYKKALVLAPSLKGNIYNNIGIIYKKKNEIDKAIEYYHKAIELSPKNSAACSNLALALKERGEFDKAIELYKYAVNLNPNFACGYYNWGLAMKDQNKPHEAIPLFKKSLEIDPDFTDTVMDLAICLLVTRNFEEGWKVYENRYAGLVEPRPKTTKPKWNGESLEGKTLYVLHEQGNGDTIQFARYIPLLEEMGAKVLFKPQTGLEKLFKQSGLKAEILDKYVPEEAYDMYSLLLSLPHKLNANIENIPSAKGYLTADAEKVKEYKEKYFNTDKFKVGIFWQGSSTFKNDKNRSTKLSQFFGLGKIPNIQLYSLQKGFGEEQLEDMPDDFNIIKLGETFEDFADTAAAIENLDLVITVDSAIAHLTGALGKPVWILLSYVWEWRWFMCDDKTPWYESMKIFHQDKNKKWEDVMSRVHAELKSRIVE